MFKFEKESSQVRSVHAVVRAGACATAGLVLLLGEPVIAQPAGASPPGAPPQGQVAPNSQSSVKAKNLLVPLERPSAEVLKAYPASTDPRNLEGTWLSEPASFGAPGPGGFRMPQLPYTEKAKQKSMQAMQRQRDADAQGKVLLTDAGRCRPGGGIGIGADLFPAEVIQGTDKIVVLNEELRTRWVIHMNRDHLKNVKNAYFGDSVGHWEGDTLVVDTVGVRATEGMMGMHSENARIVSRLRKTDGGQKLELTTITHDSETYTQPFEGRKGGSYWHPGVQMLEFQCEENMEGAREGMVE